ncbi:CHASE2 domain-containing protein [Thauera aromatica]|uniref:CHASE2 domain-containing protein n=1 Tax=Thauera aromatica TaxID=59405 RepID=UPI001FFDC136|nr:adenylate/guanylate cyclase domain-containing protein [Thauera aromatica]MCK2097397.1 adenylate/guanylate cyclase domain-containing protein [Thauera aromatica]
MKPAHGARTGRAQAAPAAERLRAGHGVALAAALGVAAALAWLPGLPASIINLDESLRDSAIRATAGATSETRLSVIDIDEASLAATEPWPWQRRTLAALVETLLADYGAASVALDMVLPEPGDADGDARLAGLAAGGPVVLAVALDFVARDRAVQAGRPAPGLPVDSLPATARPRPASGWIANHPGLQAAACTGNIGFTPDVDGIVRRLPLFASAAGTAYPTLSLALLLGCQPPAAALTRIADANGEWRLPYRRSLDAYTVIPAWAVLDGSAPRQLLEDRLVLIGASALGLADRVATPLHASTTGVMVHAVALSALLDARDDAAAGRPPGRATTARDLLPMAWLALSLGALTWLAARTGALRTSTGIAAGSLLWAAVVVVSVRTGTAVAPLAGFAAHAGLAGLLLPYEWRRQQQAAHRLRRTFEHYVAKSVLDELLRHPDLDSLTPAYREVTVLVADMEAYSSHTERLALVDAGKLTRDMLGCLTAPIIEFEGTLDKYTGDGLVAFWGAPIADPRHAERALAAARAILARIAQFNFERAARGEGPIRVRIGIESGRALVGDLGTTFRSTYTAVGDCINIASRLQEMGRELPWDVLVGETTAAQACAQPLEAVATLPIRGLARAVKVFRLADVGLRP